MNKEVHTVIIGHLAFNHDVTPYGDVVSYGGAGYYSAVGASVVSENVGIVSRVGKNDQGEKIVGQLETYGINTVGVECVDNQNTAKFATKQDALGSREFTADLGVAENVNIQLFPKEYRAASYIHLSTAPPEQYITWIDALHHLANQHTIISIDTFETFVRQNSEKTIEAMKKAGLIFINEEEWKTLSNIDSFAWLTVPYVLKRGAGGASYIHNTFQIDIKAPKVTMIDNSGAGDVLAGAFLAARAKGTSITDALTMGVEIASQSVTQFGVDHLKK